MKTTMKVSMVVMFALFAMFTSCSSDDDDNSNHILLTNAEIPSEIIAYVSTHFPADSIIRAEREIENNVVTYDIYLNDSLNLEFNSEFEIIEIDGIAQLPDSVIPQPILDYVSQNYPSNFITGWELEANHQQVELNNGIELEFDMYGNFIRIDND